MNILPHKLATTNDQLTSRAGLLSSAQVMESINLSERIDKYFPAPKSNRGFKPSTFIETLILMQHEGSFHLDDVRHIQDDKALRTVLGLKNIPQATSLGSWLRRMGNDNQSLAAWHKVNKAILRAALHRRKGITLDIDATEVIANKAEAQCTFLENHATDLVSVDFFTVPTATFRILYVFVILHHERREIVHFNVTEHPTAQWAAQQLVEAFPFDSAPRYVLRDRDSIYGGRFRNRVKSLGIDEVITAPRSPWQNPYVERIIGSIRRECLNHVIIINEWHLRRQLKSYSIYYHEARTHLSLDKQSPVPRSIDPPEQGKVVAISHVGGLHHEYRRAA
jgi:putative transposase